jgi:hypothetical protein
MWEPETYHFNYSPQRSSSIRLRKNKDEMKQQCRNTRRSGDFGSSLISDNVDSKVGTLDPGPVADGIQHNLRPLIRNKYRQHETHGNVGESLWSDWGTWGREGGGKIKHFGMIDQPQKEDIISCHSLQSNTTR